ncbi:hypothetical protein EVAR_4699_1 [Eumeta japonica]|uniref:Uncharacterized protein n=1 Tax=Eumeta variegata TaxID=151549 RepID=A0A4C1WLT0_EUMVA|nr:hypothetical protein EVAR_4699_1 [Eumeta japonica]
MKGTLKKLLHSFEIDNNRDIAIRSHPAGRSPQEQMNMRARRRGGRHGIMVGGSPKYSIGHPRAPNIREDVPIQNWSLRHAEDIANDYDNDDEKSATPPA